MKISMTYRLALGCLMLLMNGAVFAQHSENLDLNSTKEQQADKRLNHYWKLRKLGYSDKAIFEDLGNANFLAEHYDSAVFWYEKLQETSRNELPPSYQKRYEHALQKQGIASSSRASSAEDWFSDVKADYTSKEDLTHNSMASISEEKYKPFDFNQESSEFLKDQLLSKNQIDLSKDKKSAYQNAYSAPIAITNNGKTAYFSKPVEMKPLYGLFSKKDVVHKIYRAEKINGQWKNIRELAVCPKYASAMHPTVSPDGKRLFFASNMPGTFGEFDIYVSSIQRDGSLGIAKNLGQKVNTKKNDLYPTVMDGGTLFFASEGRDGYGGLDVYMTQVGRKKVELAVNLGNPINSTEDDFAISLMTEKGMGYVMSNRGKDKNVVQRVAFSYAKNKKPGSTIDRDYNLLAAFNNEVKIDYTSSVFEDE